MFELVFYGGGLSILVLFFVYGKWNNSRGRRERFLGTDAPEIFDRLEIEQESLHFEPELATSRLVSDGRTYRLAMRSREGSKLPYGHGLELEFPLPGLLPETVHIEYKMPTTNSEFVVATPVHVTLLMPRDSYDVLFEPLCMFLFDKAGKRLVSCLKQRSIELRSLEWSDKGVEFDFRVVDNSAIDIKDDESRRAFITEFFKGLVKALGELEPGSRTSLELYGFVLGQIRTIHPDWHGLKNMLFLSNANEPASLVAWDDLVAGAQPDHMSALLDFDPERLCAGMQPFEMNDLLVAVFTHDSVERAVERATELLAWLEPTILYNVDLPLDFRLRVLELWLEQATYSGEELAPAIALMNERMSKREQQRLTALTDESALRGGLSQSGEALQGALTAEQPD